MKQKSKTLRVLVQGMRQFDWSHFHPRSMDRHRLYLALRAMIRPLSSVADMKDEKAGSLLLANGICLGMFVVSALEFAFTGFPFNYNDPDRFNFFLILLSSSVLLFLWTVANWGICSLLDGEGTFQQVWIVTCYAMLPRVLFTPPMILISRILTLEEQGLYQMISALLLLWCGILLMLGMMVVHQYTVRRTVASVLLSIAGIAVILFIAMLFFSMGQQLVAFVETVVSELRYRM
mgnify:CR=1 FL=1